MFAGTALSVHLFVCAGLSLFIIYGPYLYVVVCVLYAYNLTIGRLGGVCLGGVYLWGVRFLTRSHLFPLTDLVSFYPKEVPKGRTILNIF